MKGGEVVGGAGDLQGGTDEKEPHGQTQANQSQQLAAITDGQKIGDQKGQEHNAARQ